MSSKAELLEGLDDARVMLEFGMYVSVCDALPAPSLFSSSFVVYILVVI